MQQPFLSCGRIHIFAFQRGSFFCIILSFLFLNYFFPSSLSPSNNCNSVRSGSPAPVVLNETYESSAPAKASAAVAASVFTSGRRVTRSQQGAINTAAKKYPLRQSRSSGSDTEATGERVAPKCFQCILGDLRTRIHSEAKIENSTNIDIPLPEELQGDCQKACISVFLHVECCKYL